MKPKTSELMKFKRLCRRLNEPKRGVVGLLELLWNGTAQNCPEGDIGRFSNEEIAIMCDWDSDPEALVAALVETHWLDEHPDHRLLIHDWPDHAPDYIHGSLRRWGKHFAGQPTPGSMPGIMPEQGPSLPYLTLPNVKQSIKQPSEPVDCYEEIAIDQSAWEAANEDFASVSKELNGDRPAKPDDRETIVRGVLVARRILSPNWLDNVRKNIRRKRNKNQLPSPYGYLQTCLINACKDRGVDFHRAAEAFVIPEKFLNPLPARASP